MGEFKGTKGKWFACCNDTRPHFLFTENGETSICAFIKNQEMREDLSDDEFKANALLISKAPCFYEDAKNDLELYDELLKSLPLGLQLLKTAIKERKKEKEQLIKQATEL